MTKVSGAFEVEVTAATGDEPEAGRMFIDKQYHGELQGRGKGQMLSTRSSVAGSAGYVALEKFHGTLKGKNGGFILLHMGTMAAGRQNLSITIVPDSGSAELQGISGEMDISIDEQGHHYLLSFQLPE